MTLNAKDAEGFYRLPEGKSALISMLLPRASNKKIAMLVAKTQEHPIKYMTFDHLTEILTDREASLVLAAIELGKMAWAAPVESKTIMDSPEAAYNVFSELLRGQVCENFVVLFLDIKNRLIDRKVVSTGSWSETLAPIKEILRLALLKQCPRIIVAHNHPSGSSEPSPDDLRLTQQLGEACKAVTINLLDHLVVTDIGYISIRRSGLLGVDVWGSDN
jgi:DNA repair protein RadC